MLTAVNFYLKNYNNILSGLTGTLGLLGIYFLSMRLLAGSWEVAYSQFQSLWIYMVPLSLGFGVQVGLYRNLKQLSKTGRYHAAMAGSTATSTIGMIACCAHHLTDVLPILGFSAVSIFLVNFQIPLLLIGITSNMIGIIYLLRLREKIAS